MLYCIFYSLFVFFSLFSMKNDHQPSNIIFNKIQKHDEKFKTFNGYFASFNSFDSLEQLVLVDQKNAEEN